MNEMVERVLLLCPDCDPEEVENDLNLTSNVELTINRALDGMLSPKTPSRISSSSKETNQVTIIDDNDDDIVTTFPSTSKFTNIKEKKTPPKKTNSYFYNGTIIQLDTNKLNSDLMSEGNQVTTSMSGTKKTTDTFFEISDSDSETDLCQIPRKNAKKFKPSKTSDSVTISKKYSSNIEPIRTSSPESDCEFLIPVFDDYKCKSFPTRTANEASTKIPEVPVSVVEKPAATVRTCSPIINIPSFSTQDDVNCVEKSCENLMKDDCLDGPPKKKKRSRMEIEEQKKAALLKKEAKQRERQEKLDEKKRQRDAKAADLQQKKSQVEKDKLQKKAEKLTKSTMKLDGCVKFITACLDPSLLSNGTLEPTENVIIQKLCLMGANYKIKPQPHPGTITWERIAVQHSVLSDQIASSNSYSEENEVLVVLAAEQFADMVFAFKQSYQSEHETIQDQCTNLVNFTRDVKSCYSGKKVTFLLLGLEEYMRNAKIKQQRAFRNATIGDSDETQGNRKKRKKKLAPTVAVTRTDIEEALVDLQIKTNVCVYPCETAEDIAMKVGLFTKAVAERPYKKSLTDGLAFCLDKLDKTALKVSKDGQGMINVWQQQIQQFRNVSREMAAAVVTEFPSPQLLLEAYQQCSSDKEAMHLLEDILVRRGGGSLATSRRIGPQLSKRFYILFHSKDNSEFVKG